MSVDELKFGDNDVLADITTPADYTIGHNVAEVPDFCAFTYAAWFIYIGRFVDKKSILITHDIVQMLLFGKSDRVS